MTDLELVRAFCAEDRRQALGILYQRYGHLVVGLCLDYLKEREAARDATMEIFEKVTLKVCDQPIETFRAWLFYTSRNYCIDLLRKQIRERERQEKIPGPELMESEAGERPLSEARLALLPEALAQLPVAQARCVRLFYLSGMTYVQVCERTGYDLKQVKSYLQNGRRNLRIHLEKLAHERSE
ncbi:sigma-70 family RNA polymerase sigma factor [Neolewinella lacunae]|nr:sigma-70 family RNA polymerase sigma factor [Neolewinella lacunae]MDN3634399.1 sigma-70 family RNA polymerase sigma factor [Neolewinella lacunae]